MGIGGIQRKLGFLSPLGNSSFWGGYEESIDGLAGSNGDGGNLGQIPADRFLKAGTFAKRPSPYRDHRRQGYSLVARFRSGDRLGQYAPL